MLIRLVLSNQHFAIAIERLDFTSHLVSVHLFFENLSEIHQFVVPIKERFRLNSYQLTDTQITNILFSIKIKPAMPRFHLSLSIYWVWKCTTLSPGPKKGSLTYFLSPAECVSTVSLTHT